MKTTPTPRIEDRIKHIRADIEAVIEARVEMVAKESPGVPRGVIRNLLTARRRAPVRSIWKLPEGIPTSGPAAVTAQRY
jgi:hypothetical protein